MSGHFPKRWIHGSGDCNTSTDPVFQSHPFDENTYIIRQSKCSNFEAPFLYLIIGENAAFLLDTGAAPEKDSGLSIRQLVDSILSEVQKQRGQDKLRLIVGHSHAHGDHAFGYRAFKSRPNTLVVPWGIEEIKRTYSIGNWETDFGELDLGSRVLTIIPCPGHEEQHICVYDRNTKLLFSGDLLYPGKLVINNWLQYLESVKKLVDFVEENDLSYILGAHIEMKNTPGEFYEIGTTYQPDEHALQLELQHLRMWAEACQLMKNRPVVKVLNDFIIYPVNV